MFRIILLGPPGSGKGTQGEFICREFSIPKIATGDILRSAIQDNTKIGQSVQSLMNEGQLVPDELIIQIIQERISRPDCATGFLFDGFPRTIPQADAMEQSGIPIDVVIELAVPDDMIVNRMSGRLMHIESGRVYHKIFNPPKVPNQDDITGEPLIHRNDDEAGTVRKRLQIYHRETEPLIQWFKKRPYEYHRVEGIRSVEEVHQTIVRLLQPRQTAVS